MGALAWLAIPIGALLLAVVWAAWTGRSRTPRDPRDSVESYHRFVAALDRTRRAGRPPDGGGRASPR